MRKQIGYIGLGKMGFNMTNRLKEKGWDILAYDSSQQAREKAAQSGVRVAESISELIEALPTPRVVWFMVPHEVVEEVLDQLMELLQGGDVVIDGGNSYFKLSVERARRMKEKGIAFLDAGVSGGPIGAKEGACVMVGGEEDVFRQCEDLFRDIAAPDAYQYFGESGAGHFVKMVHNGIEYGMMQAIAEGFALMKESPYNLHLTQVADIYNHRSVVESRLVEWLKQGLEEYGENLEDISGEVSHSGEGQWTVETAKEMNVPVKNIEQSLQFRIDSQGDPTYTGKLLSAMRNAFGGHTVTKK